VKMSLMKPTILMIASLGLLSAQAEKPVTLLEGLSESTRPIATNNAQAQQFFDQGLKLLYGFNRYEALRSFRRATELDPRAPMPLWGSAMSLSPHINMDLDGDVNLKEACQYLNQAKLLLNQAPPQERALVEAALTRCTGPQGNPLAYANAMRRVTARFPDDLDAAAFYAEALMIPVRWRWWSRAGLPAAGVPQAIETLEAILRRSPQHLGANHFYIHAVEASPTPERAIPSAQRLMSLTPQAGHLTHMPGHIWLRTGDYALAASLNERAARSDEHYMHETGVNMSAYVGYYIHNLHFVAYGRQMQGRRADALKAARAVKSGLGTMADQMPAMVDAFVPLTLFALARFEQWDGVLAEAAPNQKSIASTALYHWGRALAFHGKGDAAGSAREQKEFEALRRRTPPSYSWLNNKASSVLALASATLNARLASTEAAAIPYWRRAVLLQDGLIYDEPPAWFYPLRESLGGALLRNGQASAAEAVFRQGLRDTPRNGRMLFGLAQALKAQHKESAAAAVQLEFETAWRAADIQLTVAGL
jgi:tetratricopeptide (TPR) repeat protein